MQCCQNIDPVWFILDPDLQPYCQMIEKLRHDKVNYSRNLWHWIGLVASEIGTTVIDLYLVFEVHV